ncbi:unnamed protein product [Caenorhabditis angaria]|uniref:Ig-like domain-containing protein n=1 Tax=Caenorhabditis angaria TaxID=860376 RepID=A0A9P1N0S3_9PELO|nr:unnamed protein product [Caenorhabditis angaria]
MFQQFFLLSSCILGLNYAADFEKTAICDGLLEKPGLNILNPMESKTSEKGSTVILQCEFGATPQATITWFHRGKKIEKHRAANLESLLMKNQIGTSVLLSKYRIDCLDESTAGEYYCQATSPCSEPVVSTALVTIDRTKPTENSCKLRRNASNSLSPPIITFFTSSRVETPEGVVQLACRAEGNPKPKINWSFVNEDDSLTPVDLTLPEYMQLQNGDLLTVADETKVGAPLRCTATNQLGTAYEEAFAFFMEP